ncbi:ATP-binding cassette domain-containing protein [Helcococcus massiliensis]|uniref:ATP-binding cassette domain-containing protein n=1 Tax=Helcococcus massiliensis TaxID=2040290 RepID=UPI0013562A78|nr:ABC transporter ATP-binding protein [Helcococcus massiliensis]
MNKRYIEFSMLTIFVLTIYIVDIFNKENGLILWSNKATSNLTKDYLRALFNNSRWKVKNADLVDLVSGDINSIRGLSIFYEEIIPRFCDMFLFYIVYFIVSISYSTYIFLIPPIAMLLMRLVNNMVKKLQDKYDNRRDRNYINMSSKFMEDLNGINTILMYRADDVFQENFDKKADDHRKSIMFSLLLSLPKSMFRIIISNIGIILSAVLIFKLDIFIIAKLVLVYLNSHILINTKKFSYYNRQVMSMEPVLNRVLRMIKDQSAIENENEVNISNKIESIEFKDVYFKYADSDKNILEDMNLKFARGNFYHVVGKNGSGKSTLISLIKGRNEIDKGKILVNDIDISNISSDYMSEKIAIIEKDSYILSKTIKDNLLYASNGKMDIEETKNILEEYSLLKYVNELSDGLDTNVGEGGSLLSPGQKAQLLLAMYILNDKDVYILDEGLSSVNPENRDIIINCLKKLAETKIIINISHYISDINDEDMVVFFDDGKVYMNKQKELFNLENYKSLSRKEML